jgi:hypothetical protein
LLPRNGGELIEELIEAVASLEVVDEISERNSGPDEHRSAPKDVGVAMNDRRTRTHVLHPTRILPQEPDAA